MELLVDIKGLLRIRLFDEFCVFCRILVGWRYRVGRCEKEVKNESL